MFGEHHLKSGLAKRVSFRAGAIRVAPPLILGTGSSYFNMHCSYWFYFPPTFKRIHADTESSTVKVYSFAQMTIYERVAPPLR